MKNLTPCFSALPFVLLLACAPFATAAGTVNVCDEAHLKLAIAGGGDVTINCLDPITLTSAIQIFAFTRIFGRPDPQVWGPTISGGGSIQIMAVRAGARVWLDHLVLEGGRAGAEGGAILNDGILTINKSLILNNNAPAGGAIANHGELWLFDSQVNLNSAERGGAIANAGKAAIDFSSLGLNTSSGVGGGIYNSAVLEVTRGDISNNSAAQGGGIFNESGAEVRLLETTLRANDAHDKGGALANRSSAIINNSVFWLNRASLGAAVRNSVDDEGASLLVRNTTFAGNASESNTPALWNNHGQATLDYTTFADNTGGSVYNNNGSVTIGNSVLARNPFMFGGVTNCGGTRIIDAGYNLSDEHSCQFSSSTSRSNTKAELDVLRYNGGWTLTIAPLADSPLIDTIPVGAPGCPSLGDQRFVKRPQGPACDIGAYEVNPPVPPPDGACNGSYAGHFTGTLFVDSGSTCEFVGGSISGNVHLNGGTLRLSNVTVDGSVEAATGDLSIGPSTIIRQNLEIHQLSGVTENRVCGAHIQGNVEIHNNVAAITIGSDPLRASVEPAASAFCAGNQVEENLHVHNNSLPIQVVGNTVNGDLEVHDNDAEVEVVNNMVRQKLFCHANASIQGGPNPFTKSATGQCYQDR